MGRLRPSNRVIIGVALMLFAAVLLAAGLNHLIKTGTCSSTGYNQYGPTAVCPAGEGAWIGFLIGGIFLVLIGAAIGGAFALTIPVLFMAIGAGSMTVVFDKGVSSGSAIFGLIFGGCFFVSGLIPGLFVLRGMLKGGGSRSYGGAFAGLGGTGGLTSGLGLVAARAATRAAAASGSAPVLASPSNSDAVASPLSTSDAAAAFGGASSKPDAIMGAYAAGGPVDTPVTPTPSSFGTSPSAFISAATGAPKRDVFDQISKLADLHTAGVLTDEEFQREKAKLLDEI
ncbi:MAG: SHOCT domain-containing protein [Solirubrobacteraceae bacterium]